MLLESEDHECPDCKEKDVSPDTLIPNRFLRNNVNNFKNETGYNKSTMRQRVPVIGVPQLMQQVPPESSGPLHEFSDAPTGLFLPLHCELLGQCACSVKLTCLVHFCLIVCMFKYVTFLQEMDLFLDVYVCILVLCPSCDLKNR